MLRYRNRAHPICPPSNLVLCLWFAKIGLRSANEKTRRFRPARFVFQVLLLFIRHHRRRRHRLSHQCHHHRRRRHRCPLHLRCIQTCNPRQRISL